MNNELKYILEALLLSSDSPLTLDKLAQAFPAWEQPSHQQLSESLSGLMEDYKTRALELRQTASGYCLQTKVEYAPWINRLNTDKPTKYSRALLETLAIIAYRQPVTRADIEEIRGVTVSSSILKTLLEREWIRIAGHREVPGKPTLYATSKQFLDDFRLKNLYELPVLEKPSLLLTSEEEFV